MAHRNNAAHPEGPESGMSGLQVLAACLVTYGLVLGGALWGLLT